MIWPCIKDIDSYEDYFPIVAFHKTKKKFLFEATHSKIQLARKPDKEKIIDEDEFLELILNKGKTGIKSFIIEGDTGTGKSELCVELKISLEKQFSILYLSKELNYPQLITEILSLYKRITKKDHEAKDVLSNLLSILNDDINRNNFADLLTMTFWFQNSFGDDQQKSRFSTDLKRGLKRFKEPQEGGSFQFFSEREFSDVPFFIKQKFPTHQVLNKDLNRLMYSNQKVRAPQIRDLLLDVSKASNSRIFFFFEDYSMDENESRDILNLMLSDNPNLNITFIIAGTSSHLKTFFEEDTAFDRVFYFTTDYRNNNQYSIPTLSQIGPVEFIRPYLAFLKTKHNSVLFDLNKKIFALNDQPDTICNRCNICKKDLNRISLFPFNETMLKRIYEGLSNKVENEFKQNPRGFIKIIKEIFIDIQQDGKEPFYSSLLAKVTAPNIDTSKIKSEKQVEFIKWYGEDEFFKSLFFSDEIIPNSADTIQAKAKDRGISKPEITQLIIPDHITTLISNLHKFRGDPTNISDGQVNAIYGYVYRHALDYIIKNVFMDNGKFDSSNISINLAGRYSYFVHSKFKMMKNADYYSPKSDITQYLLDVENLSPGNLKLLIEFGHLISIKDIKSLKIFAIRNRNSFKELLSYISPVYLSWKDQIVSSFKKTLLNQNNHIDLTNTFKSIFCIYHYFSSFPDDSNITISNIFNTFSHNPLAIDEKLNSIMQYLKMENVISSELVDNITSFIASYEIFIDFFKFFFYDIPIIHLFIDEYTEDVIKLDQYFYLFSRFAVNFSKDYSFLLTDLEKDNETINFNQFWKDIISVTKSSIRDLNTCITSQSIKNTNCAEILTHRMSIVKKIILKLSDNDIHTFETDLQHQFEGALSSNKEIENIKKKCNDFVKILNDMLLNIKKYELYDRLSDLDEIHDDFNTFFRNLKRLELLVDADFEDFEKQYAQIMQLNPGKNSEIINTIKTIDDILNEPAVSLGTSVFSYSPQKTTLDSMDVDGLFLILRNHVSAFLQTKYGEVLEEKVSKLFSIRLMNIIILKWENNEKFKENSAQIFDNISKFIERKIDKKKFNEKIEDVHNKIISSCNTIFEKVGNHLQQINTQSLILDVERKATNNLLKTLGILKEKMDTKYSNTLSIKKEIESFEKVIDAFKVEVKKITEILGKEYLDEVSKLNDKKAGEFLIKLADPNNEMKISDISQEIIQNLKQTKFGTYIKLSFIKFAEMN